MDPRSSTLSTLDDLSSDWRLAGRTILVRVDFNVPVSNGVVVDDTRIELSLPTIRSLTEAGARVVLVSHRGRPKGSRDESFSLRPVAARLAELLPGRDVTFGADCIGEEARRAIEATPAAGGVCLLENLRFHAGETTNDDTFAAELSSLAEAFVGDAFGTAHRAHASVVGVASRLAPRRLAAGHLLVAEVEALGRLLHAPPSPFVAILGGAKIAGKIETLENLLQRLDVLLVGGGMANTFLAAQGHDLASSLVESERLDFARALLERTSSVGRPRVVLPSDLVVTDNLDRPVTIATVAIDAIPDGAMAVDVGPATTRVFTELITPAASVFWNGPLGVFEKPPFDAGTEAVARCLAECRGFTVIGGGETVAAVNRTGASEHISHVSTGGGASLALLAGKTLPGIEVLEKK